MSDYTLTPNYSLYKPTLNADGDQWGNHWNLNADKLDTLLGPPGPGGVMPFLPLTGGTVTGATTFTSNLVGTSLMQGQVGLVAGTNSATTGGTVTLNAIAGSQRYIAVNSAGSLRMRFGIDGTAESGANAGSNPFMNLYSDTSTLIGQAWSINRATMQSYMPRLRLGQSFVYAGGAASNDTAPLNISANYSGNTDRAAWVNLNNISINSDTLDVGAQQAIGFNINHNVGGAGALGNRTGLRMQITSSGAFPSHANFQSILGSVTMQHSCGGTDLWSGSAGIVFGGGIYGQLFAGATNWRGVVGAEIDYGIYAGATAAAINGLQLIRWTNHAYSPAIWELDTILAFGSGASANNAKIGLEIGQQNGFWPIDANGRLIGAGFTNAYSTTSPMQSAHGVDFYNVDLTGTAFRARGFSVLGSGRSLPIGTVQVGGGYLSSSGATVSLDAVGNVCTGAAVASGGANLLVGLPLIHDASGTLAVVSAVAGGVATAVTLVPNTGSAHVPPANPVTFRVSTNAVLNMPGPPTAPTLNLTWTASATLALNPSGGPVTVRGMPLAVQQALYSSYTNVGNGADTTVDTLQTFTMAAGQLKNVGDRIIIRAGGAFAASTDSKMAQCRLAAGPLFSVTVNAPGQAAWRIEGEICKTGANAQTFCGYAMSSNNISAGATGAAAQADTGALTISIIGQNTTTATASSITCRYFTVDYIAA